MRSYISSLVPALLLFMQAAVAQNLEERGHGGDCPTTVTVTGPCVSVVTVTVTATQTSPGSVVTVTITETATQSPFSSLGPVGTMSSTATGSGTASNSESVSPVSSLLPASHTHTKTHTKTHGHGGQTTETGSASQTMTGEPTGPSCHGCPPHTVTYTNESGETMTKTWTDTWTNGESETSTLLPASGTTSFSSMPTGPMSSLLPGNGTTSLPACPGVSASVSYITITDTIVQTITGYAPSASPLDRRYNKMWNAW